MNHPLVARSLALGTFLLAVAAAATALYPDDRASVAPLRSDAAVRDLDIDFYRARVARDRFGAADRAQLGRLYLQRARETGDNEDLARAEAAARESLALRRTRNGAAFATLASSLMGQHRFAEALEVERELLAWDSTSVGGRGLLAETQMELGSYDDAARTFGKLRSYAADLAIAPRLARWAELCGHPEDARRLLRAARDEARHRHALPREQLAWFHLRLGDLALRYGRLDEAEGELEAGLGVAPDDYRLLGTLARLHAARHEWRMAIEAGERAIARALDPTTLGLLSDSYLALGDTAKAGEYSRALGLTVLRQPGSFHRAWSLFLLDHGRGVPTVLAKVRDELRTRRDIYGWDLLAWALYRSGRPAEATDAMARALALGTRDAMLFFHAGVIAHALGRDEEAARFLAAALTTNPVWHPTQPAAARALLDSLRR